MNLSSLNPTVCLRPAPVSAAEFQGLVRGVAAHVSSFGPRVLLQFDDSFAFAVALFACLSTGRTAVLLPSNRPGEVERLRSEYDDVLNETTLRAVSPVDGGAEIAIADNARVVFYTSGSTGQAKPVLKTWRGLVTEVRELEKRFGASLGDSLIVSTAIHQHIYGFLFKVLWPTLCGRTWLASSIEYPEQLEKLNTPFTLISTPAFLKRYFSSGSALAACKAVFSSGGVLDFAVTEEVERYLGRRPIEIYGSTESGGVAFRQREFADQPWTPFAPVQIERGLDGELILRSPYFEDDRLVLADRIEYSGDGFHLLGRGDDTVKIEDKRVSLSDLTARLKTSPWVRDAAAVSVERNGRQQIACVTVLTAEGLAQLTGLGDTAFKQALREYLRPYFESILLPRVFKFVEHLPHDERGKTARRHLTELFNET